MGNPGLRSRSPRSAAARACIVGTRRPALGLSEQTLCSALCRIGGRDVYCTTIVQSVVQDHGKRRWLHNYCAVRCAGSGEKALDAQLLCKVLCRIGGKRGSCTTIVQGVVQGRRKRRQLHNDLTPRGSTKAKLLLKILLNYAAVVI